MAPAEWLTELFSAYFPGVNRKNLFSKKSTILDVGCGNGGLLYFLKEIGFQDVLGIEPYGKDIIYSNGVVVLKKFIHEIDRHFDLIMFHHSFEHVEDPIKVMQCISRMLSKNGTCLIRMPTVDSYAWKHYKHKWVQLDAPRHFHIHSNKSMKLLADMAGLELIKVVYDSSEFQFWGSEQYMREIPLMARDSYGVCKDQSIFSENEISMFKKNAEQLNANNQGDSAAFYLRKPF